VIAVFETVLVEDGRIRLREHHLARLAASGATDEQLTIAAAHFDEAVLLTDQPFLLRVDVDDEGVRASTRPARPASPADLAIHWSYDPALEERRLKTADRRWADRAEAAVGGEALLVERASNLIGESTRASLLVRTAEGDFATPRLRGILPGVTRAWAIGETTAAERDIHLDELRSVRGAALLTAGRGVVRIATVEGIPIASDPALDDLARRWRSLP